MDDFIPYVLVTAEAIQDIITNRPFPAFPAHHGPLSVKDILYVLQFQGYKTDEDEVRALIAAMKPQGVAPAARAE
jgi:hypothetical protein